MQIIENEVFYHIQRNNHSKREWKVGDSLFVGSEKNDFIRFYDIKALHLTESDFDTIRNGLFHYMRFTRETIFEEIRQTFFPGYPSRQRCIWVVPDCKESLDYWRKELGNGKLFKLELTGKIHRANQEFLNLNNKPLNDMRQRAFKYWSGTSGQNKAEEECLFEGFVNVLEEINTEL